METVTDQQDVPRPKKGSPLMTDLEVEEIAKVEGVVDDIKGVYKIEPCEEQRIQYRKDVPSHMTVAARPMNDVPSPTTPLLEKSCSLVEMRGIRHCGCDCYAGNDVPHGPSNADNKYRQPAGYQVEANRRVQVQTLCVHVGSHMALVHDELFHHGLVWAWAGLRQFHDGQEPS
ncbi:unnamed protein product [Triticum turgidum subsp. durum]|uniref:Uncharacterized protein n=3 Tax=Triticum TaxID=4564 RepID=A0A9R0RSY0_TRITD|nr:unnamed protein product [Triticum turgidum subsp. durum]